jgi:predicted RecA/RadA family phage recombinase
VRASFFRQQGQRLEGVAAAAVLSGGTSGVMVAFAATGRSSGEGEGVVVFVLVFIVKLLVGGAVLSGRQLYAVAIVSLD